MCNIRGYHKPHPLLDEMLDQLKHGCYPKEVAELLGVSLTTVRYHTDERWRKHHSNWMHEYHRQHPRGDKHRKRLNKEEKLQHILSKLKNNDRLFKAGETE